MQYRKSMLREGVAKVNNCKHKSTLKHLMISIVTVDITGQFIPYLRDDEVMMPMEVVAVPRGDGETQQNAEYDGCMSIMQQVRYITKMIQGG